MSRTRWSLDQDRLLHRVILTVETDEPATVHMIEEAALRAGVGLVRLVRELADEDAREDLRGRVRDAIRGDVDPAKLPGLEPTVDRVIAALARDRGAAETAIAALMMIRDEAGRPLEGFDGVKDHGWCAGVANSALASIEEQM